MTGDFSARPISEVRDQLPALLLRYKAGESAASLGREFSVNSSSLTRAFARMGTLSRDERSAALRAKIVHLYEGGGSVKDISEALDLVVTAVRNHLHAAKVPLRGKAGQGALTLPEDVLTMEWALSEAGAWVCGLVVTDGHLRLNPGNLTGSPSLRLVLKEEDRDGVLTAAALLGLPEERVRSYQYKNRKGEELKGAGFEFTHPKLWFLARDLGMPLGDKTATARLPDALAYDRHAWRGVLDGDGSAYLQENATCLPEARIALHGCSLPLHEQFAEYCASLDVPTGRSERKRGDKYSLAYTTLAAAEPAARLADELYRDASYTIERKRDRAWAVREARLGKPGRAPRRPRVTPEQAADLLGRFEAGTSIAQLERDTGRSYTTIQGHLRRLGADV